MASNFMKNYLHWLEQTNITYEELERKHIEAVKVVDEDLRYPSIPHSEMVVKVREYAALTEIALRYLREEDG